MKSFQESKNIRELSYLDKVICEKLMPNIILKTERMNVFLIK